MILGLSLLFAFIFLLMLNAYVIDIVSVHQEIDDSYEICVDGSMFVDFLRIENYGLGDAQGVVYVGSVPDLYYANEAIPLLVDSGSVIDSGYIFDSSGLIVERGVNYVHFILKGNQHGDDVEIMDFSVDFYGAQIVDVVEDEEYPLEKQGDGLYTDSAGQDEVILDLENNYVEAFIRVSSASDGFYLYYSCE